MSKVLDALGHPCDVGVEVTLRLLEGEFPEWDWWCGIGGR